jgi:hypothetical protein
MSQSNLNEFIQRAQKIHADKDGLPLYDYSSSLYKNVKSKLQIICKFHGIFLQSPNNHLKKRKCPNCANTDRTAKKFSNTNSFTKKALKIHGNNYDYSTVKYITARSKIKIKCNKCNGVFEQTPNSHLSGHGCSYCGYNISILETKWLDLQGLPNDGKHRNVTITTRKGNSYKVDGFNPKTNTIYEFNGDFWHGNPSRFKPTDINPKNKLTFGELYNNTLNKAEDLCNDGYAVVTIWESDFKKSRI